MVSAVIVMSQVDAPASEAITSLMTEPTIDVAAAFAPRLIAPLNSHAFVFPAPVTPAIQEPLKK